jgi:hypothetical protein
MGAIIIHFIELKFVQRLDFLFFLLVVKTCISASCFLYFFVCVVCLSVSFGNTKGAWEVYW